MAIFTDTFNRANGAPGGNWVTINGTPTIENGWLRQGAAGNALLYNTTLNDSGRHEEVGQFTLYPGSTNAALLLIKLVGSPLYGYGLRVGYAAGTYSLQILSGAVGSMGVLASTNLPSAPSGIYTMRLIWDDGHLLGEIPGFGSVVADSGAYANGQYMGLGVQYNVAMCNTVTMITGAEVTLSIDPEIIPNFGECSDVTLTGTNTEWVAGIPGEPIFTVDHGAIESQEVIDSTHAVLHYCPGDYLGPVCFTDPSTNTQVCTIVSSDPDLPGGEGGCRLDQFGARIVNDTGLAHLTGHLLTDTDYPKVLPAPRNIPETLSDILDAVRNIYTPANGGAASGSIDRLWKILNNRNEQSDYIWVQGRDTSIKEDVDVTLSHMEEVRTIHNYTLGDMLTLIKGGEEIDITELWVGIMGEAPYAFPSIMEGLDSIQNVGGNSIANIVAMLNLLTNAGTQDIDTILAAISGMRGPSGFNLDDIYNYLQTIMGDDPTSLAAMMVFLVAIDDKVTTNQQHLVDIRGPFNQTFQTIIDAIGGGGGGGNQAVLDAIAALRGDNVSTVKAILDSLTAYRTANGYTVRSILDAIGQNNAHPNYDVLAVLALLALALMGDGVKLADFVTKLASGKLDLIVDIIGTLIDGADFFLDLWNTLKGGASGVSRTVPPTYPGAGLVDLGEPIPFNSQITIVTPMDGALIEIATPGEHPFAVRFTEPTRYGRLGVFSFACDVQRYEPIQPIQWLNQIATPKSIIHPTGLVVQCKAGTVGTVIPWTLR